MAALTASCAVPASVAFFRGERDLFALITMAWFVATLFGACLFYYCTRPAAKLVRITRQLAGGAGRVDAPVISRDEADELAQEINRILERLENRVGRLETYKAELKTIFENIREGILLVTVEGEIVALNPSASEFIPGAAEGVNLTDCVRSSAVLAAFRDAVSEGNVATATDETATGELEFQISGVRGERSAVVVVRRLSETKKYELLRRQFVANVSHEFRTPLGIIKGYLETLASGALEDRARAGEFVAACSSHVERLAKLVDDLLDISRLEAGRQVFKFQDVAFDDVVRSAVRIFEPIAAGKRQELSADIAEGVLINGNRDLLERAVSNLISNAIKYTPESGKIGVVLRLNGRSAALCVQDTGIGIAREHIPHIFERFYRVDKSRSREGILSTGEESSSKGGTGLGLAIVKHVVQLHRGDITVESEPGKGSKFTITVPCATSPVGK